MVTQMNELLADIQLTNFEGAHFHSEKTFLDRFSEELFNQLLDEILSDESEDTYNNDITSRRIYQQTIFDSYRICLGILTSIWKQKYIFRFCEDDWLRDERLPTTMDVLKTFQFKKEDAMFAKRFYEKQFVFKPYTFSRSPSLPQLQDLVSGVVFPVVTKTPHAQGGWSMVYKIEIHPDYDNLGYTSSDGENPVRSFWIFQAFTLFCDQPQHVYACEEFQRKDEKQRDGEDPGYVSFRQTVSIQYAIQDRSEHILPLLVAYIHRNTYQMIFPMADDDFERLMYSSNPPDNPIARLDFIKQVQNIISAIRTIHEFGIGENSIHYDDKSVETKTIKSQNIKSQIIEYQLHISPHLILFRGGHMLGQAEGQNPTTMYLAPESSNQSTAVGRAGHIWTLACIMMEILTFILLGREGVYDYKQALRHTKVQDGIRVTEYASHYQGYIKKEVLQWFDKLGKKSDYSKGVVETLTLIQEMLNREPKKRPNIAMVEAKFSDALAEWEKEVLFDGDDTPVEQRDDEGSISTDEEEDTSNDKIAAKECLRYLSAFLRSRNKEFPDAFHGSSDINEMAEVAAIMANKLLELGCLDKEIATRLTIVSLYDVTLVIG